MATSPRLKLDKNDFSKLMKSLLIGLAGAALVWATTEVIPALEDSDNATLLFLAGLGGVLVNFVRKWLSDNGALFGVLLLVTAALAINT